MAQTNHFQKLDAIRGVTACYVVLYHLQSQLNFIPDSFKKLLLAYGQEAVIIFFVLSGFVIFLSVDRASKLTFKEYFLKRFRRIYFPFFISIVLSIIIFYFSFDTKENFNFLSIQEWYLYSELKEDFRWKDLIGNLFMLQDFGQVKPGTWFPPFLANYPLWSLSYEWWFYMLFFPLYIFLPKKPYRILFILLISSFSLLNYIFHPNQLFLWLSYFIIWWSGVELAHIWVNQKLNLKSIQLIIFSLGLMILLLVIPLTQVDKIQFGYYPFLFLRHFIMAFLVIVLGTIWYQYKFIYFQPILGVFAKVAPISYGLYIFHYPILKHLNLEYWIPNLGLVYLIKFALIIGLSYLVEVKLQPIVNQFLK